MLCLCGTIVLDVERSPYCTKVESERSDRAADPLRRGHLTKLPFSACHRCTKECRRVTRATNLYFDCSSRNSFTKKSQTFLYGTCKDSVPDCHKFEVLNRLWREREAVDVLVFVGNGKHSSADWQGKETTLDFTRKYVSERECTSSKT